MTAKSGGITVGLVTERAAERPLPEVHAPVVAQGLGVAKQLPTLAAVVGLPGAVDKLVAVEVGDLAETLATGAAGKGQPTLRCLEPWAPVLRPRRSGGRALARPAGSTGALPVTTSPGLFQSLTRLSTLLLLVSCSA